MSSWKRVKGICSNCGKQFCKSICITDDQEWSDWLIGVEENMSPLQKWWEGNSSLCSDCEKPMENEFMPIIDDDNYRWFVGKICFDCSCGKQEIIISDVDESQTCRCGRIYRTVHYIEVCERNILDGEPESLPPLVLTTDCNGKLFYDENTAAANNDPVVARWNKESWSML